MNSILATYIDDKFSPDNLSAYATSIKPSSQPYLFMIYVSHYFTGYRHRSMDNKTQSYPKIVDEVYVFVRRGNNGCRLVNLSLSDLCFLA